MEHRLKELSRNSVGELSILCARLFPWCRVLTWLGYVPWRIDKSSSPNHQKLAFRKTKLRISLFWLHLMENILFRITVLATFYFPFFFSFFFFFIWSKDNFKFDLHLWSNFIMQVARIRKKHRKMYKRDLLCYNNTRRSVIKYL